MRVLRFAQGNVVAIMLGLCVLACGSYDHERVNSEADAFARSYLSSVDSAPSLGAGFLDREFFPTLPSWALLESVSAELGALVSLQLETSTITTGLNRSGEMFVELTYEAEYAGGAGLVRVILRRPSAVSPWTVRGHLVSYESMTIALAEEADRFLEGYFASMASGDFDHALDLYSESFFGAVSADEWRATLSGNRHTWGRPDNRSLIEADGLRNVLTGATIIALGYTVEYENRPVIERFTISWALLDHLEGILFHEIAID